MALLGTRIVAPVVSCVSVQKLKIDRRSVDCFSTFTLKRLKLSITRISGERNGFPDVLNSAHVSNETSETKTIPHMRHRTESTQVKVPPVVIGIQAHFVQFSLQQF